MKMIQLRNVPDRLHRKLKIRAAEKSMTLSDYLLAEIKEIAEKPSLEELANKIEKTQTRTFDSTKLVRELRDHARGH